MTPGVAVAVAVDTGEREEEEEDEEDCDCTREVSDKSADDVSDNQLCGTCKKEGGPNKININVCK